MILLSRICKWNSVIPFSGQLSIYHPFRWCDFRFQWSGFHFMTKYNTIYILIAHLPSPTAYLYDYSKSNFLLRNLPSNISSDLIFNSHFPHSGRPALPVTHTIVNPKNRICQSLPFPLHYLPPKRLSLRPLLNKPLMTPSHQRRQKRSLPSVRASTSTHTSRTAGIDGLEHSRVTGLECGLDVIPGKGFAA